jgi:hypothetical protein
MPSIKMTDASQKRKLKDAFFRHQNPQVKVGLVCGFIGTEFHGSCFQVIEHATCTSLKRTVRETISQL